MGANQKSLLTLGEDLGFWDNGNWDDIYDPDADADEDYGTQALADARLWGIFDTGETCWWLPVTDDPAGWLVVILGRGWQQLNISTTEFLRRWTDGLLDLPVLISGAIRREWHITPAGQPVTSPLEPAVARAPLAQLQTIVGPGPSAPPSFDWAAIEADLGRPVPPDYKRLHETYGRVTAGGGPSCHPHYYDALAWNGIHVPSPRSLKEEHESHADYDAFTPIGDIPPDFPSPDELLLCCTTAGRDLLAWDTRNPDPARWPVINMEYAGPVVFPGTLTELLVADLTGTGPGTGSYACRPGRWLDPIWGPDAPRET